MRDWELKDDPCRGWVLNFSELGIMPVFPRYRGAFEEGERPPGRVRISSLRADDTGASARFRAPLFPRRNRSFGVSVEISPEIWQPEGSRRGWHFFSSSEVLFGLWSSLPATWLAQNPDGSPLPPPWSELFTFGSDHIWACRVSSRGEGETDLESFVSGCVSRSVRTPRPCGGSLQESATLSLGDSK